MREEEFRQWLVNRGNHERTFNAVPRNLKRVEDFQHVNLDEEFQKDQMASLLNIFTYSIKDEKENRQNPTELKFETDRLARALGSFKSQLNQYRKFCLSEGDNSTLEEQNNDTGSDKKTIIALEAHLQAALRANMPQFDPNLTIIDDGIEHSVETGFIDILAKDKDGCFVVIELKAGTAKSDVMGQTLGYMADIAEEENAEVRGIIVAGDFHKRVRSAARLTPKIELISYRYNFDFSKETPKPLN